MRSKRGRERREAARRKSAPDGKDKTVGCERAAGSRQVEESARLANRALANALAVSEKELAEANEVRSFPCRRELL